MTPNRDAFAPEILRFVEQTVGQGSKQNCDNKDLQIVRLAGDASARRYARVICGNTSMVLMIWEPFVDDGQYPFLSVLEHFAKHGVKVPQVIAKSPAEGLVLLEDLGDLTLERKFWENQNQTLALPFYKMAIDELIKIHYPATQDTESNCVAFKVAFNTEKLLWEMNYGREHLLEKLCKINLTPAEKKALDTTFLQICEAIDKEDKIICHRDYHSRNIMLKNGEARIIDFQDARLGAIQYDLVSLVHDSYVDLNESTRNAILDDYLVKAKDYRKAPIQRDHFYAVFRLQMIQRCFKACGSFASFYNMREDKRYLKYLKPTVTKVAQVLGQFPEYKEFLQILHDRGLLEHDYLNPNGIVTK